MVYSWIIQTHVRLQPRMLAVHRNTFLKIQQKLAEEYDWEMLWWKVMIESVLETASMEANV